MREGVTIIRVKGINSYVRISDSSTSLNYPTFYNLKELNLIKKEKEDWRWDEYILTELGQQIEL